MTFFVLRGCKKNYLKRLRDIFCPERLHIFFVPRGCMIFFCPKRLHDFFLTRGCMGVVFLSQEVR